MELKAVVVNLDEYPKPLRDLLEKSKVFDSSCSLAAKVLYIDRDDGYFLKQADASDLAREYRMTQYFHSKGLGAEARYFAEGERAWLLTKKVKGDDCVGAHYLAQPERLCDTLAQLLSWLHRQDFRGCPVPNHTARYLDTVERNYQKGHHDLKLFSGDWGFSAVEEVYEIVQTKSHLLQVDTLLHGDYCLPNVILDNWKFSGFVDLDSGGVGDRHVDLLWGAWTLNFNLKTDAYRQRFFDAYGRDSVDEERLRLVAACEVFG